jgi:hypothetical protein
MEASFEHFVFVDFENVPKVDLGLIDGKPVHVTLLIGKNQGKVDFALVDQIHRLAAQVKLVKIGASGHNALDLTVAFYLGRAVEKTPAAQFHIVSKDKDFEPMITHASGEGIRVVRCDSFETLPFLPKPKKATPVKAAPKPNAHAKATVPSPATEADDRLERLVTRLQDNAAPRPKKRSSLLARINTDFGNKLTRGEQEQMLAQLVHRRVLTIGDKEQVHYLPAK